MTIEPLKILLSGSSGFIGSGLKVLLELAGHDVVCLVRDKKLLGQKSIFWNPCTGQLQKDDFEGFDAVIHLAGAGIADHRWTKKYKEQLFLSRCRDTWLLSQVLCRLYRPPKVMIAASAIGYYGDRGQEELAEDSPPGNGFLANLCKEWEKSTDAIENRGTRVVHTRFGAVLGKKGGMLCKMLTPFRCGLGGKLGSGQQIISWISIDDLLESIHHCLRTENISQAVNLVSPQAVTQAEFARLLAKKLKRAAFCHIPAPLIKLFMGEMGKELILASQNVIPQKLLQTGYSFRHPNLQNALDYLI